MPVSVVRELYGVMAAQGAAGGFVVTSGVFTADAHAFAKGRNIRLIDGPALQKMVDAAQAAQAPGAARPPGPGAAATLAPACPRCGAAMRRRVARQGDHAGQAFWGCSTYPRCRGVREMD